jgi:hypothetical protein
LIPFLASQRSTVVFLIATLSLAAPACSGANRPPVYPVHGQLFYQGKPAANALVVFHALDENGGTSGMRPHATVQADGSYALGTYGAEDGAPAGEYAVTVEWWLAGQNKRGAEGDDAPTNHLPARFASPKTSRLAATVQPGTNEVPAFNLAP